MKPSSLTSLKWALPLVLMSICSAPAKANDGERYMWHPWFELGGFYNSDDASRGEGILFTPLMHGQRDLLFADIRMKFFEEDVQEANVAIGYRRMSTSGFNYGAWIGADIRESEINNRFSQLSGGFEALSHNLDFRVNWYGPGTDAKAGAVGFTQVNLVGNNIFMVGGQEVQLQGVDGEIGVRIPVEMANIDPNKFELRAYAGAFYFDDSDALEQIAGGKGRISLAMNDILPQLPGSRLTVQYEYSHDDVRDDRHEVGGRLRIPLSAPGTVTALSTMGHQERRMMERLERDTDIITSKSKRENVEDALTNVNFDRVALVNNGGSITNTSTMAGANSLLIVNGTLNSGAQTVQANQTVQGGGSTIQVRGRSTGTVAGFTAPGSKPTVINPGGGNVISLTGDNTHIAGLLIDGNNNGNNGIRGGGGQTNIVISQNMIQNTGNNGIRFGNNNSNIRILDNSINMTSASEGIDFGNRNTNVTIDGNTITNPLSDGILFNNRNTFIVITNNVLSGGVDEGIEFDDNNSNLTISGNTISGFGDEGININDNNSNIVIANNTIFGVGDEGIEFNDRNSNVTITGNTIVSAGDDEGIQFDDRNQNITIANNTITAGDNGIQFDNNNTGLSITGNTIVSTTETAIDIDNTNTGTISGNTFTAANGDGINLNNNNAFTISDNTFNAIGDDAIRINANNTIGIADNIFNSPIGGQLLDVDGGGTNALSGTGNISNAGVTCESGTFTGTVEVNGIILQDGVAPCN